jgi:hypothetical protein
MYYTYADLGSTNPARVNRSSGRVILNKRIWHKLPEYLKKNILDHEEGHYKLKTKSELEADAYAFYKYAGTEPGSLKKAVAALMEGLSFQSPEHHERLKAQIKRALQYDWKNNRNPKAKETLDEMERSEFNNFLGLGSKAKKTYKQKLKATVGKGWRADWKEQKKADPRLKANLRAQDKAAKDKAKNQAIQEALGLDVADAGAADLALKTMSAGQNLISASRNAEESKKILGMDQTTAMIIGIVILVIIVAAVIFFLKRKK